ncbi:hypothetical protein [Roseinatronobacter sp. NSM]|uniref:hypothetical protein n=1 Tax=Roseinatronobacter sp. NSM TaxID=3457785 RepID=UPI004035F7B3
MVNTRKLEQLLKRSDRTKATGNGQPESTPLRRGLALSGGPTLRNDPPANTPEPLVVPLNEVAWDQLDDLTPDPDIPKNHRIFNQHARIPTVTAQFDVLRTQLVQTFRKRGLRSLGIASPNANSGTSFVAAGLLASFARRTDLHVVGLDLNFARPAIHHYFEAVPNGPILSAITGSIPVESHLRRASPTLALGLNRPAPTPEHGSAAFPAEDFTDMVQDILGFLGPDFVICDLPPLLEGDCALNLLPGIDAVLVVSNSHKTCAEDIAACERILHEQAAFLGVVLNRAAPAPKGR